MDYCWQAILIFEISCSTLCACCEVAYLTWFERRRGLIIFTAVGAWKRRAVHSSWSKGDTSVLCRKGLQSAVAVLGRSGPDVAFGGQIHVSCAAYCVHECKVSYSILGRHCLWSVGVRIYC